MNDLNMNFSAICYLPIFVVKVAFFTLKSWESVFRRLFMYYKKAVFTSKVGNSLTFLILNHWKIAVFKE